VLSVIRPSFEVVKEGRILHFVSGYRKFLVNAALIQGVAVSMPAWLYFKINLLQEFL
jgi:hypothetical protein